MNNRPKLTNSEEVVFIKDMTDSHNCYNSEHDYYTVPISGHYTVSRGGIALTDWYVAGDRLFYIDLCILNLKAYGPRTNNNTFVNKKIDWR